MCKIIPSSVGMGGIFPDYKIVLTIRLMGTMYIHMSGFYRIRLIVAKSASKEKQLSPLKCAILMNILFIFPR